MDELLQRCEENTDVEQEWDNAKKKKYATKNSRRKRTDDKRFTQEEISKRFGIMKLTLRRLMSYIYIYIYIYMEHPFLMFLDHTQRRSTVGRTPLDE